MTTKDELKHFVDSLLERIHKDSEHLQKKWKHFFGEAIDNLNMDEVEEAKEELQVIDQISQLIEDFTIATSAEEKSKIIETLRGLHDAHSSKKKGGLELIGSYVWKHAAHLFDHLLLGRTPDEFEETVQKLLKRT
jgi:hypothetical protein